MLSAQLVQHALTNVWCTPTQDAQALLKLTRATAFGGARDYVNIYKQRVALPDRTNGYHLYHIGANDPARFKLDLTPGVWFRVSDICSRLNKIIDLYTVDGLQFSRNEAFVLYTRNKSFVLAVRLHPTTANLNAETLYLRLYTNAYYDSVRSDHLVDPITSEGRIVESILQSTAIQNNFHQKKQNPIGFAYAFHNGRYVHDFPPNVVKPGDSVEYVYDAAIYRVVDLRLDDLPTFSSELDGVRKYLLHPPKQEPVIAYRDDLDFWVIHKQPGGNIDGVYYHRNSEMAVRMLTHNDYSIPVGMVQAILDKNPGWEQANVFIRIHCRRSGYHRPLVYEANAIHELYKLSDAQIIAAMVGNGALVHSWKVTTLEGANYPRIMRSLFGDISGQEVYSAYGYDAVSRIVGDSPRPVQGGKVKLPIGALLRACIFEYNAQGTLLGYYQHWGDEEYIPVNAATTHVEVVIGGGSDRFAEWTPQGSSFTLDPNQTQRFYACKIIQGQKDEQWFDVTEDSDFVTFQNGVATLAHDRDAFAVVVRGTEWAYVNKLELNLDTALDFQIANRIDGVPVVTHIPCGKLELWLNGHGLIENIDYYVQWPSVVICSKEYINPALPKQNVVVRGTGLCKADMSRHVTQQIGWVANKTISINGRFDVRDAKVIRCVVGGRTLPREVLAFSESGGPLPAIADGRPYAIDEQLVPVIGIRPHDVYFGKIQADLTNAAISDYLSIKLPEPDYPISAIPRLYELYSPLVSTLLGDIISGILIPPPAEADNNAIIDKVMPYRWLLGLDPCTRNVDGRYAVIHAHPFDQILRVSVDAYRFIERVIGLYLGGRVDLTPSVGIVVTTPQPIDPYWGSVAHQLRFDGLAGSTTFSDDVGGNWLGQNGAKLVGTGSVKHGTLLELNSPVGAINGDQSDIAFTDSTNAQTLDGDFSIEFVCIPNAAAFADKEIIIDTSAPLAGQMPDGWFQLSYTADGGLSLYVGITNAYYLVHATTENALVVDEYNHVAWVRKNGVTKLFINGVNVTKPGDVNALVNGGVTDTHVYGTINRWIIGRWNPAGAGTPTRNIRIDNLRITVGVARYESNFDASQVEYYIP